MNGYISETKTFNDQSTITVGNTPFTDNVSGKTTRDISPTTKTVNGGTQQYVLTTKSERGTATGPEGQIQEIRQQGFGIKTIKTDPTKTTTSQLANGETSTKITSERVVQGVKIVTTAIGSFMANIKNGITGGTGATKGPVSTKNEGSNLEENMIGIKSGFMDVAITTFKNVYKTTTDIVKKSRENNT